MPITKHILKLAEGLAKERLKDHLKFYRKHLAHCYDKENTAEAKERYLNDSIKYYSKELTRIKNALIKGRYYSSVKSVSASGMSRIIIIGYIYKNKFRTIRDEQILSLAGVDKNGRIGGCGMDMLFHAQYTLFNNLHNSYKVAHYQKRMKEYNNI